MKYGVVLAALAVWGTSAMAVEFANGSSGLVFDRDDGQVILTGASGTAPSPVPAPAVTPAAAPALSGGTGRGCDPRSIRPYATETKLKIFVDQQRQVMTVQSPDFPQPLEFPVSTGGGLKIPSPGPDGKAKDPYYACTPEMKEKIITGFEPSEFAGRADCKPEDVRSRSTMFIGDTYRSNTFTTEDGQGVVMPNALRVSGGIFIHRVPPSYRQLIGRNVSGECIRVPGWHKAPDWIQHQRDVDTTAMTARDVRRQLRDGRTVRERQIEISETMFKQMKKHGAIQVTITPPPDAVCHLPPAERRAKALADAGRMGNVASTGTEGVAGGIENFFRNLGGIFSNTGSGPRNTGRVQQPAPGAERQRPSRPARDSDWTRDVFRNGN